MKLLVVDCDGDPNPNCQKNAAVRSREYGQRGATTASLAARVAGISVDFVVRTVHLLAGIRGLEDYSAAETAFERCEGRWSGGQATGRADSEVEGQSRDCRFGQVVLRSEAAQDELARLLSGYDLILFHLNNNCVTRDVRDLFEEAVSGEEPGDPAVPVIYFSGGPTSSLLTEMELWLRSPRPQIELGLDTLRVHLPRFLELFSRSSGSKLERFASSINETVFAGLLGGVIRDGFAAFDILLQGAMIMRGYDAEEHDPWWWCDQPGPDLPVKAREIQGSLEQYKADPGSWYDVAGQDLHRLFPDEGSNHGLEAELRRLPEGVASACANVLFRCGGTESREDGTLARLAREVVRYERVPLTKEEGGIACDPLLDKALLKQAHEEYLELVRQLSAC